MTDRDALLRAVAADPAADTPRLVYADLMDELGGEANAARARFIRVQVDLARDAGRGWFARADRLSEAAALAGRFARGWLDELPPWAAVEARQQPLGADDFPRGFLEALRVQPTTFRRHGGRLFDVAPVRRLDVSLSPRPADVRAFLSCPFLERVRDLTVRCPAADVVAGAAADTRSLAWVEELVVVGGGLTDAGARALARAPDLRALRVLRAERSRLTADGVAALLASVNLPSLRELDVRGSPPLFPDAGGYWGWYERIGRLRDAYPGRRLRV